MLIEKCLPEILFALLIILICPLGSCSKGTCSQKHGYLCKYWDNCGKSNARIARTSGYIVNGTEVGDGEFPFVAQIMNPNKELYCLGAIVSDYHIVTANSCFGANKNDFKKWEVKVRVGSTESMMHDAIVDGNIKDFIEGDCVCSHPDLSLGDLAVLKLKDPLTFSEQVQPACWLPSDNYVIDSGKRSMCFLIGGGLTSRQSTDVIPLTRHLQKFRVEQEVCTSVPQQVFIESEVNAMICLKGSMSDENACYGDLGGPMLCYKQNEALWYVRAILSPHPKMRRCLPKQVSMASIYTNDIDMSLAGTTLYPTTSGGCAPPDDAWEDW